MAANQQTTARKLTAAEKRQQAMKLRLAGYTYEQIAGVIGGTKQGAYKHVAKALAAVEQDTRAHAEHVRQLETARLERLLSAVWTDAVKGNLKAVERAMQLTKRITQVNGAELPQKLATTTPDGEDAAPAAVILPPTAPGVDEWLQQYGPGNNQESATDG